MALRTSEDRRLETGVPLGSGGVGRGVPVSQRKWKLIRRPIPPERTLILSPLRSLGGWGGVTPDEEDEAWPVFTFNYRRNRSFLKMQITEMYKVKNLRALICPLLDPLLRS